MSEQGRLMRAGSCRVQVFTCILLAAVTLAAFSPLLDAGFINFDDPVYVTENARVKAGVTWDNARWAFSTIYFGFYYPLTWLSHMLDCQFFGLWGGGHHLTSLLLHLASTILLFGWLRRATGDLWPSALVAALFAVHPLHVESVAWISERKDVLSTFFLMLALWAYEEFARKPGVGRYLAVLVFFLLGLMSKSMIVTAPFLMLLMDVWPLGRLRGSAGALPSSRALSPRSLGRLIGEKIPLFALAFAFAAITFYAQNRASAVAPLAARPLDVRVENSLVSYGGYLAKTVVPVNLAFFYPYNRSSVTLAKALLGAALLLLVTVLCWRARSRHPYLLIGWLWYLGVLLPVIGILQVGSQSSADRYTYFSLIGIFMALAWYAAELPLRTFGARVAGASAAACLILFYAGASWLQARTWHDSVSLCSHAIRVTESNYLAHTLLGTALQERGDLQGAENQLKAAVQLTPDYVDAWGDLGNLFRKMDKFELAVSCYERVLALNPKDARAYENIGLVLELQGQRVGAEKAFAKAVDLAPENAVFHVDLGRIEAQLGRNEEARRLLLKAARLDPLSERAFFYLGLLDATEGKVSEAEANYRKAIALAPDVPQPRINLGKLLADQGREGEAKVLFLEALRLDPGNAEVRALLGRDSSSDSAPPSREPKA